jgi:hypothetical protein
MASTSVNGAAADDERVLRRAAQPRGGRGDDDVAEARHAEGPQREHDHDDAGGELGQPAEAGVKVDHRPDGAQRRPEQRQREQLADEEPGDGHEVVDHAGARGLPGLPAQACQQGHEQRPLRDRAGREPGQQPGPQHRPQVHRVTSALPRPA